MSFDPNKPANGSPLNSAEMRGQLNGLNDQIVVQTTTISTLQQTVTTLQQTVTALQAQVAQLQQQVADNLADTSHNIWGQMPNLDPGWQAQPNYDPADFQWVLSRMIEFNNTLARA